MFLIFRTFLELFSIGQSIMQMVAPWNTEDFVFQKNGFILFKSWMNIACSCLFYYETFHFSFNDILTD